MKHTAEDDNQHVLSNTSYTSNTIRQLLEKAKSIFSKYNIFQVA